MATPSWPVTAQPASIAAQQDPIGPNDFSSFLFRQRRWLLPLALVSSLLLGFWRVPLFDRDEGIYAEATREMMARGDLLTPTVNGQPFFEKPILMYWGQAAGIQLLGENELAVRLPSVLATLLLVGASFAFVRRARDGATACAASFLLGSMLMTTVVGQAAIADPFLNLFLALSLFCGFEAVRGGGFEAIRGARRGLRVGAFLFAGLAFLTKGPVALFLASVVSVLFAWRARRWRAWAVMMRDPAGWLIFALVALPWYAWEFHVHGVAFWRVFFLTHNLGRFRTSFEGHAGGILYYLPVLLAGTLPHTAFLFRAVRDVRLWFRDELATFCALWLLCALGFFSLSGTKLPHYLSCAFPPLSILLALFGLRLRSAAGLIWPVIVISLLLLALPHLVPAIAERVTNGEIRDLLTFALSPFPPGYTACCVLGLLVSGMLLLARGWPAGWKLAALTFVFLGEVNLAMLPAAGRLLQEPVRRAGRFACARDLHPVSWRMDNPSFLFYARSTGLSRAPAAGEVVFTHRAATAGLPPHEVLFESGGVVLVRVRG